MVSGENFRSYNESYNDGADGMYDDGPYTPDWSTLENQNSQPDPQSKKEKWVNGGWAKMVHWYKENPSELGEIMPDNAEHDETWYQEHPEAIGDLARDYLRQQRARATEADANTDASTSSINQVQRAASDMEQALEDGYSDWYSEHQQPATQDGGLEPTAADYDRARRILKEAGSPDDTPKWRGDDLDNELDIDNLGMTNDAAIKQKLEANERAQLEAEKRARLEAEEAARAELEELDRQQKALEEEEREIRLEVESIANEKERLRGFEKLHAKEAELNAIIPDLAEMYARNRRLFVGAKNRAEFTRLKGEYEKTLNEYLALKARISKEAGDRDNMREIGSLAKERGAEIGAQVNEFASGDSSQPKTEAEINAKKAELTNAVEKELKAKYGELAKDLETKINAEFLQDLINQQSKLEAATIDKLDNGTLCRKVVSKILNNKILKGVLIGAGIAGLAATGIGAATGAIAVGLSYTAGGIALGAGKGALSGALMSRQSSKNSAVRGFTNEEEIRGQLANIDIADGNADVANVTKWLVGQYDKANKKDASSNKKKTAISAGLGAVFGAAMSGVQINSTTAAPQNQEIVGYTPDTYQTNINQVNIPEGGGAYDTFTQLGGDPSKLQEAVDIMWQIDPKYNLVPGSNGVNAGFNGAAGSLAHTYAGPIESWPDIAQSYIQEVIQEWARRGLIPATKIVGGPIYNTVTNAANSYIPSAFMNFIARGMEAVGGGAIGSAATIRGRRTPEESDVPIPPRSESRSGA